MAHLLRALVTLVEDTSLTSVTHMASHNYLVLQFLCLAYMVWEQTASKKKKKAAGNKESLVFCCQFIVIVLFSILLMFETHILI